MKKTASFLLCLILCMSSLFGFASTAYAEDELMRAVELGVIAELPTDVSVSAMDFFAMLDRVVALTDESILSEFQNTYPAARLSTSILTRYDGMVAVLAAAEALGVSELNDWEYWSTLHAKIGEKCWDTIQWNSDLFDNEDKPVKGMDWDRIPCAYFYSFGRRSSFNGQTIFDYDAESNSMRTEQPLTCKEAAVAALRLHDTVESNFSVTERVINGEDRALLDVAQDKINAIQASKTDISYTGTAYYVSNSGNDENDGRSPETAWETLEYVMYRAPLQPGDAVFFERGNLWRGNFGAKEGVTYSAFGEGEKPKIYGSPESGVGENKWSLWYDQGGVKIWKYHTKLQDPGGIVMNGGDVYASRVYAYWNGEKAVFWNDSDREFDVVSALKYDLQFFCGYPDDIASRGIPFPAFDNEMHGDVFLRCDAGNPGVIYEEIEFQCPENAIGYTGLIQCWADGCVIDNLCLMYSNTMAVATGNCKSITVQNCEVGFIGGGSHLVGMNDYVPVSGEGIRLDGYGNSARNNFVHDCFDGGIILEPDLQFELDDGEISDEMRAVRWGNTTIEGNVIQRCNSGILIGVHCEDDETAYVEGITIQNNDILYSGYGWSGDPHYDFTWGDDDYIGNAITFWDDDYEHGSFLVKNNRLYVAKAALIHMRLKGENVPIFSDNIYAQNHNGYLIYAGDERISRNYSASQALQVCKEILRDSNAIVIPFAK